MISFKENYSDGKVLSNPKDRSPGGGSWGLPLYIAYTGICHPIEYGFSTKDWRSEPDGSLAKELIPVSVARSRLGRAATPPRWDASPSQVTPEHLARLP